MKHSNTSLNYPSISNYVHTILLGFKLLAGIVYLVDLGNNGNVVVHVVR